jgi:predicted membrane-bound mannosyltransferase
LFYLLVFGGATAAVVVRALQRIADAQENAHRVLQDVARSLERDGETRSSSEPGTG